MGERAPGYIFYFPFRASSSLMPLVSDTGSPAPSSASPFDDHDHHDHTPASPTQSGTPTEGWSKMNLRPGERGPWTRGRDGWGGVGSGKGAVRSVSFI